MMNKTHFTAATLLVAVFTILAGTPTDSGPKLWVSRTISESSIYYEGAPDSAKTTVTLRAWASGDSIFTGKPIDVVILTDNSGSMSTRSAGVRDWIPPISRIQGTYNASVNFVDSFLHANDRAAHMRFCSRIDTPSVYSNNFPLLKAKMDTNIDGRETIRGKVYSGTAVWFGILQAVRFATDPANKRNGILPVVIALTDGEDNASGSYGSYWKAGMPTLGNTQAKAVDSVIRTLNRLNQDSTVVKVFTINLGNQTNSTYMKNIAAAGKGSWAYSASGTDLDVIFQGIGQRITDVAAISLSPGEPMLIDVLGQDIHFVPGSFRATAGMGYVHPTMNLDTVNGFTRLRIGVDTVRLEQFLEVKYDITAALYTPDIFNTKKMRTNNDSSDDAIHFSKIQYKKPLGPTVSRPIDKNWVSVKSRIGGLFLSSSNSTLVPPSATKLITLEYAMNQPATYGPQNLYSLLQQLSLMHI